MSSPTPTSTPASSGYRALLGIPGARAFFLAAAVGRVGLAMTGIGLLWLVHARTGSYGTAGLATAGFAVAEALIGPQLARLVDRRGQGRVLPFCLLAHAIAVGNVLATTQAATLIAAATCAGAAVPQLGAYSAARWAHLLRDERAGELSTAFSLESLANATAFLLGPVLVTALGAAGHERLASTLAASLILIGGGTLAAQRRTAPQPAPRRTQDVDDPHSCLLRPVFLRLAALNLAIGVYFGTMSVSISAFAVQHGSPGSAAPITAAASLSGLLAGWLYGLGRSDPPPTHARLVIITAYLTATSLLLPLAPSVPWLTLAVILTEVAVPPTLVLLNVLTENSVHPTVLTQALTWNNSASAAGSALAASLAGRTADHLGASAAFTLAPLAGLTLLLLAAHARALQRAATR